MINKTILGLLLSVSVAKGATSYVPFFYQPPVTNQNVTVLSSTLSITSPPSFFAYGLIYSNRVISASTQEPNPAVHPWNGGTYYGLNIVNDPTISQTNQQACLGYLYTDTDTLMTNQVFNFYNSVFDGKSADAVSLKYISGQSLVSKSTNSFNFYNCRFLAGHYGFNTVGYRGYINFYGCTFDVGGQTVPRPTYDDSTIGFMPDQGPVTNRLFGCYIRARDGYTVNGYLAQTNSYTVMNGCTIEVSSTNATAGANASCVQVSSEGGYLLEFNDCDFMASGSASNLVMDLTQLGTGSGVDCSVVINNCYWSAATANPIIVWNDNMGARSYIYVNGGNFLPKHFSDNTKVTWLTPNGLGLTNTTSTLSGEGSGVTNLTYTLKTNAITGVTLSFGKAYYTNLVGNLTLTAFTSPSFTFYETGVIIVTNSTATDHTITGPAGVIGPPNSGTPSVIYCTNKMVTYVFFSHYGGLNTNIWKQDFAP